MAHKSEIRRAVIYYTNTLYQDIFENVMRHRDTEQTLINFVA